MKTILLLGAKSQTDPLDSVPAELSRLKQSFSQSALDIRVEYEPYLTKDGLAELFRQHLDNTDILHFAGHSNASQLQTNDQSVYSHHIADHLKSWRTPPRLVFLNGCHNAAQVQGLLGAGVSCVIATHNAIDDQEAARFAHEFYANLLSNLDRVSFREAFDRAGSVVLLGEPRRARTLNIDALKTAQQQKWDWGLFCQGTEAQAQRLESQPDIADFMRQKKYEMTQQRWQLLFEKLTLLQTDYDLETRSEEKLRLKHVIERTTVDLNKVEAELESLKK